MITWIPVRTCKPTDRAISRWLEAHAASLPIPRSRRQPPLLMMRSRRSVEVILCLFVLIFGVLYSLHAETIVLHLKNGDRLAGTILIEDTNRVVISTSWIKELSVPLDQIVSRETAV